MLDCLFMKRLKILGLLSLLLSCFCYAESRTWTVINGKEVEAEFVSNEKGIVKLKLKSGKVFEVPLNKLSKSDQEFLKAKPSSGSLVDNIVGKVISFGFENNYEFLFQFTGDGRILAGEDGSLKDNGETYKIEGNEVLIFGKGKRDGGISFTSSSPKVGDQVELGPEEEKMKGKIIKIEKITKDDQKPPTVEEMLGAIGTPLNQFEKIIANNKYLEKSVVNEAVPNSHDVFEPAETINRANRIYSILYSEESQKDLVHGIWMIKDNHLYWMELVSGDFTIPNEMREVLKAKIITLNKEKSFFFLPPKEEENYKGEKITWELIERFTSPEMKPFNNKAINEIYSDFFDMFKIKPDFADLYGAVKLKVESNNSRSINISKHPLRSFNGLYEIQEGLINNKPWYKNENDRFLYHYNQAEGGEKSWSLDHRKPDGTEDIFSGGWTKFNNSQIPDIGLNDWYSIDETLYEFVENGSIDDVKLFIRDGAKINHPTPSAEFNNMSILDIAIAEGYTEIAEILRQNGAKTSKELSAQK